MLIRGVWIVLGSRCGLGWCSSSLWWGVHA